jgi:hypothetical protein
MRCPSCLAADARTAVDVPGHHHQLAGPELASVVPDVNDFGDGLVAQREGSTKRSEASNDCAIQVAGCRSDRPNNRIRVKLKSRLRNVDMTKLARRDILKPSHSADTISTSPSCRRSNSFGNRWHPLGHESTDPARLGLPPP